MISLVSGLYEWVFAQRTGEEIRLLLIGLDGSGKTTFVECLKSSFSSLKGGGRGGGTGSKRNKKEERSRSSSTLSSFSSFSATHGHQERGSRLSSLHEERKNLSPDLHLTQTPTLDREGMLTHTNGDVSSLCSPSSSLFSSTSTSSFSPSSANRPCLASSSASFSSNTSTAPLQTSSSSPPPPLSLPHPSGGQVDARRFFLPVVQPTTGFNLGRVRFEGHPVVLWDLGGRATLRSIWREYIGDADCVLFFVDASDVRRLDEARKVFRDFCLSVREHGEVSEDSTDEDGEDENEEKIFSPSNPPTPRRTVGDDADNSGRERGKYSAGEGSRRTKRGSAVSPGEERRKECSLYGLLTMTVPLFVVANKQDCVGLRGGDPRRKRIGTPRSVLSFFDETSLDGRVFEEDEHDHKRKEVLGYSQRQEEERGGVSGDLRETKMNGRNEHQGVHTPEARRGVMPQRGQGDERDEDVERKREGEKRTSMQESRGAYATEARNHQHSERTQGEEEGGGKTGGGGEEEFSGRPPESEERCGRLDGRESATPEMPDMREGIVGKGVSRGVPFWCIGSSAYDEASVQTLLRCAVETAKLVKELKKQKEEEEGDRDTARRRRRRSRHRQSLNNLPSPHGKGHQHTQLSSSSSSSSSPSPSPSCSVIGIGDEEEQERDRGSMSSVQSRDTKLVREKSDRSTTTGLDSVSSSTSSTTCASFSSLSFLPSVSARQPSLPVDSSSSSLSPSRTSLSSSPSLHPVLPPASSLPLVKHPQSPSAEKRPSSADVLMLSEGQEEKKEDDRNSSLASSSSLKDPERFDVVLSPVPHGHTETERGKGEASSSTSTIPHSSPANKLVSHEDEPGDLRCIYGEKWRTTDQSRKTSDEKSLKTRERGGTRPDHLVSETPASFSPSLRRSSRCKFPESEDSSVKGRRGLRVGKVDERRVETDGEEEKEMKNEMDRDNSPSDNGLYNLEEALENFEDFFSSRMSLRNLACMPRLYSLPS